MRAGAAAGESVAEVARRTVDALRRRNETVAVAESCTAGWLGRELTAEAGASDTFWGGVIVYADEAKQRLAGVSGELIARRGAVSEEVAIALAEGVRERAGSPWSVAITGIAGPGGGSDEKPVGTVWIAVAGPDGTTAIRRQLSGDRTGIRAGAVDSALRDLLGRLGRAEEASR
ncbi:MAG: CinA family protein [Gemmatimonadota bacterium]